MNHKKVLFTFFTILSIVGYGVFVFAAPSLGSGGFIPGETLNPDCEPGDTGYDCKVKTGWLLGGNTGTDDTADFIGTTDAQDFVIKTNGSEVARFPGALTGGISMGQYFPADILFLGSPALSSPIASGADSFAVGSGSIASGNLSVSLGVGSPISGVSNTASGIASFAIGMANTASGTGSFTFGISNTVTATNNFAFGEDNTVSGTNGDSYAFGEENSVTSLHGDSYAFGTGNQVSSDEIGFAFGRDNIMSGSSAFTLGRNNTISGQGAFALGESNTSSGDYSYTFGYGLQASSGSEITFGFNNSVYTPVTTTGYSNFDRLFTIGNGPSHGGGAGNAYTMWKDGSFAYNDDDFAIDNAGTDQNMFYFNYGNHDGDGNVQTKKAIRLGSAKNNEWDIGNVLVGDYSIAIGFADSMYGGPKASGYRSTAIGNYSQATGDLATAIGSSGVASGAFSFALNGLASGTSAFSFNGYATGDYSTAFRGSASGYQAMSFNSNASGDYSYAFGPNNEAASANETVFGLNGTIYTPLGTTNADMFPTDRLFTISNGDNDGLDTTSMGVWDDRSDAFTILKNGQVGIAIDNFEANNTGYTFEIGDGGTNVLGYFDNLTLTGWITTSDERKKHNIEDLSYGLDEIMQLRPVSFDFNFNNQHTIGFLAQQVLPIIPESVKGSEEKGYGMSYVTLVPVAIKAIQELDMKIESIEMVAAMQNQTFLNNLIAWFADATNGIERLFAGEVHTDKLCVGETCVTESQLQQLLQGQNIPFDISEGFGYGYGGN